MYLRRCYRNKDGKRDAYWAVVESYRTARGPRQRVVACPGEMDERGRLGVQRCAEARGYWRDHRSDAKQVKLALAVSRCGMPLGYKVFAGHRHDATRPEEMVEDVEGL